MNGNQNGHLRKELLEEEVPQLQPIRAPKNDEEGTGGNGSVEDKRPTRIPTSRFRGAIDKLKQRRQSDDVERELRIVNQKRVTSIPKLIRKNKNPEELQSNCGNENKVRVEDAFEKIYDEIVTDEPKALIDEPKLDEIIADVKDPDEKFEEVVHAYEEDRLQPINTEKPKSRIPLKKQFSDIEAQVPKQRPVLRKCISEHNENNNNQIIKETEISNESGIFVETEDAKELVSNTVEIIGFESNLETFNDSNDQLVVSNNVEPEHQLKESEQDAGGSEESKTETSELELKHTLSDVDDVEPLRGKVSRLINKIKSNEFGSNGKKRLDVAPNIPKKVSVLSKVSMFEKVAVQDQAVPRIPPPTPIIIDKPKTYQQTSFELRRPIVVEEIHKAETLQDDNIMNKTKSLVDNETTATQVTESNSLDVKTEVYKAMNNNVNEDNKDTKSINDEDSRAIKLISGQDVQLDKYNLDGGSDVSDNVNGDNKPYITPRKLSVSDKIALFEKKRTPITVDVPKPIPTRRIIDYKPNDHPLRSDFSKSSPTLSKSSSSVNVVEKKETMSEDEYSVKIEELRSAKTKYGVFNDMKYYELNNGLLMPVISLGTALLDPVLIHHIITTAIDLGYRAIDTAYIYGNEKSVGEAIRAKMEDGTVTREDLFITNKLWSTFHRRDLVEVACRSSLDAMGLDYFDLYLIHNPMSFKEGSKPLPKIANVVQFSSHDYLEAWFGMEDLVSKKLVKSIGVSNFNSLQINKVVEKARIKPVVNQVESHPYLNQLRLADVCGQYDILLMSYGSLGSASSEGLRSPLAPVIEDPVVKLAAAGVGVSPAQLLLRYQLDMGRAVVTKASSGERLWNNLVSLTVDVDPNEVMALHALNRNKRMFTFKGMGETHRHYPFNIPF